MPTMCILRGIAYACPANDRPNWKRRSDRRNTDHQPAAARADERIRAGLDWRNTATKVDEFLHQSAIQVRLRAWLETDREG